MTEGSVIVGRWGRPDVVRRARKPGNREPPSIRTEPRLVEPIAFRVTTFGRAMTGAEPRPRAGIESTNCDLAREKAGATKPPRVGPGTAQQGVLPGEPAHSQTGLQRATERIRAPN